jgi:dolichol-phosphate mannosyltransferase
VTAGYRAFRADALRSLPYKAAKSSGYAFQVEMAMRAHQSALKVVEVPITFRDRTRGTSKMGTEIVLEAMRLVTGWGWERMKRGALFRKP